MPYKEGPVWMMQSRVLSMQDTTRRKSEALVNPFQVKGQQGLSIRKKQRELPPEVYAEANESKNEIENLGKIRWNRLSPLS